MNQFHRFLFSFTLVLLITNNCLASLSAQLYLNDAETSVMKAGEATNLKLEFFDTESAEPLHHFHPMHEKEVHLILISEDFESFAHLHPIKLSEHLGFFGIDLNHPTNDPYNLDAASAATKSGKYFVFAESMPMGFSMTTLPLEILATGQPTEKKPLVADLVSADGYIYKNHTDYRVKLKVKTFPHCGTFSALLDVELQQKDPVNNAYTDVIDLEPWLNSFAHTVMLSEQGITAQEKNFIHLHAVWPLVDDPETERGPFLRIASDNHNPMIEGVYKIWIQFKHRGSVQTIPFVITIKAPPIPDGLKNMCL